MRVVRNIVATGRTITVTIHQPAIDIFEVGLTASTQLAFVPAAGKERGLHSLHMHAVVTHAATELASAPQQLAFRMTLSLAAQFIALLFVFMPCRPVMRYWIAVC